MAEKYIIKTTDTEIVDMMKQRGCRIYKKDDDYLIFSHEKLKKTKKFISQVVWTGEFESKFPRKSTETGSEEIGLIKTNKGNFKALKVSSAVEKKEYYKILLPNNTECYLEVWLDEKGNPINSERRKSDRLYIWSE